MAIEKNIVFVVSSMEERSGLERVVATLVNGFVERYNNKITVITRDLEDSEYGFEVDNRVDKVAFSGNLYVFLKKVQDFIRVNRPSCVISNNMGRLTLALSVLSYKQYGTIFISYEHVAAISSPKWVQVLKRIVYKKVDKVVVLSSNDEGEYKRFHNNVYKVVNPLPFELGSYAYTKESKRIISLGRLTNQKGYDLLLRAWKIVEIDYPEWSFHVYGKGEDLEDLLKLRDDLGIKRLIFEGLSLDVKEVYNNASFYVMSSRFEGFGMVLIEAQAFSLPLVSFNCPHGPSDIINNSNGILVENGNIKELAVAIRKLIDDRELRVEMSYDAFESAKYYTIDNVCKSWNVIIN
ncbi:glycosyltransferase family 4 protein [Myroides odoratimimus]|uniref:glycosyltransferase family 4 protein n=1 Tax=Myroides odoratimimus TaxID=76832 RepID=UPI0038D45BE9